MGVGTRCSSVMAAGRNGRGGDAVSSRGIGVVGWSGGGAAVVRCWEGRVGGWDLGSGKDGGRNVRVQGVCSSDRGPRRGANDDGRVGQRLLDGFELGERWPGANGRCDDGCRKRGCRRAKFRSASATRFLGEKHEEVAQPRDFRSRQSRGPSAK